MYLKEYGIDKHTDFNFIKILNAYKQILPSYGYLEFFT